MRTSVSLWVMGQVVGAVLLTGAAHAKTVPSAARADAVVEACSWDSPGRDPFMGDVVQAVDRYPDIPVAVRERLKARMAARKYDDMVTIGRDTIRGKGHYEPTIRDMHFGENKVCRTVTRARWSGAMQERGLVYCDSGHCILVPTVCRNVSRISLAADLPTDTAGSGSGTGGESPSTPEPVIVASSEGAETESFEALASLATPRGSSSGHAEALYTDLTAPPTIREADYPRPPPLTMPYDGVPSFGPRIPERELPPFIPGPPGWVPNLPDVPTAPVPEPAQWAQLALGACLLGAFGWKRRRARG